MLKGISDLKPDAISKHGFPVLIASLISPIDFTNKTALGKKHVEQYTANASGSVVFKEPRANKCRTYDPSHIDNTKNFLPLF